MINIKNIICIFLLCFFVFIQSSFAQSSTKNIKHLVRIQDLDPDIQVDLRYASNQNFTGKKVYPMAVGVLREETAQKLVQANKEFHEQGYNLKVWDAYRPPYVQKIFWELVPDDRYVANPYKGGSRHNRGGAVDVTLVDKDGKELEMPSGFDDFSEKAWPNNPSMSPEAKKNMDYLRKVMVAHGFDPIEHEWWHFDDRNWKRFPLVDVQFEKFLNPPKVLDSDQFKKTSQVIMVKSIDGETFKAELSLWQKTNKEWQLVASPMPAVVGRNGIAQKGQKKEGDGRTPSGIYPLRNAFGYSKRISTHLKYHSVTSEDIWVDDPHSRNYNRWMKMKDKGDAQSFEQLKRADNLYEVAAVIEYNTDPIVPGEGSAIFLHVWRDENHATSGCVALSKDSVLKILKWLNRKYNPVILIQ